MLTKEEEIKVFCQYGIGAPILTIDGKGRILCIYPKDIKVNLHSIKSGQSLHSIDDGNGGLHRLYLINDDQCKLLLTPLSDITDEHLVACYHLHSGLIGYDYTCDFKPVLEMARHWIKMDGKKTLCKLTQLSEYLKSNGYAIPLFFGINHPENGKF